MAVRRSIGATRNVLRRLFFQRCFYLFFMLLALVAIAPLIDASPRGMLVVNLINTFIILASVAAVGRSTTSFLVVLCFAAPALAFRWLSVRSGNPAYFDLSLKLDAVVYAATILLLLRYVFDREVMSADRLWGAAAAFLLLGVIWSILYALIDAYQPQSFAIRGTITPLARDDLIYFSFSTLTTTGFGDIIPITRLARTASTVESIVGQLFLAILIAKLVGVYPAPRRQSPRDKRRNGNPARRSTAARRSARITTSRGLHHET